MKEHGSRQKSLGTILIQIVFGIVLPIAIGGGTLWWNIHAVSLGDASLDWPGIRGKVVSQENRGDNSDPFRGL